MKKRGVGEVSFLNERARFISVKCSFASICGDILREDTLLQSHLEDLRRMAKRPNVKLMKLVFKAQIEGVATYIHTHSLSPFSPLSHAHLFLFPPPSLDKHTHACMYRLQYPTSPSSHSTLKSSRLSSPWNLSPFSLARCRTQMK